MARKDKPRERREILFSTSAEPQPDVCEHCKAGKRRMYVGWWNVDQRKHETKFEHHVATGFALCGSQVDETKTGNSAQRLEKRRQAEIRKAAR